MNYIRKAPATRDQAYATLEREQTRGVYVPYVVESTHRGERSWDPFSRLLKDRIVFIPSEINDDLANVVIAQFLILESEDPDRDITLYINSPGGVVYSGLAIYDTMQVLRCPVATTCVGMAASMAAVLLAAGQKGHRSALPHARIMIHQPHGGARGQASDIEIQAKEVRYLKDVLTKIVSEATGKPSETVVKDMDRDNYMSPAQAKEYGLIDEVLPHRDKSGKGDKDAKPAKAEKDKSDKNDK
ncbi:MAG: ATP-dependent Clp protease proteolytic subunit [Polyangiaceae bacterium]